ncbi:hypothetical protein QU487_07765 [Crenobacter sp. SG2305]|uniref:hypothetical protein n=1 Tax=Crenobacter oryzisoli TaxID=3056844 RepID=UPI0025AA9865|nr:hypothetical protein [Crenobacter sp. SG2305]MDN0082644.1 hypothetical protein [Crenobacter sp. SG2305]
MAERSALLARYQTMTEQVVRLAEQNDWPALQACLEERAQLEHLLLGAIAMHPVVEQERQLVQACVARLEPLLPKLEHALDGLNVEQAALEQERQGLNRVGLNLQRIGAAYR